MNVLIFDQDVKHTDILKEICFKFFFHNNIDSAIETAVNEGELYSFLKRHEFLGIYMAEAALLTETEAAAVRSQNPGNYIILLGQELSALIARITPITRPAGCIVKPAEEKEVERLLSEVLADYKETEKVSHRFSFQIRSTVYSVDCEKILYFEGSNKKILLRTHNQEYEFYGSLDKIMEELPQGFLRTHKSFIVNMKRVKKVIFSEMMICFEHNTAVFLSRTYRPQVQEYMKKEMKMSCISVT